jgi:hypothetical protein
MYRAPAFMLVSLCLLGGLANPGSARQYRSPEVAREFQHQNPCPSTRKKSGPCPGYVKDHVVPLACGGADKVANLQWQTIPEARAKDRVERRCQAAAPQRQKMRRVAILRGH